MIVYAAKPVRLSGFVKIAIPDSVHMVQNAVLVVNVPPCVPHIGMQPAKSRQNTICLQRLPGSCQMLTAEKRISKSRNNILTNEKTFAGSTKPRLSKYNRDSQIAIEPIV